MRAGFILFPIAVVLVCSCRESYNRPDRKDHDFVYHESKADSLIQGIYYIFPSPGELMEIVTESDIQFNENLLCDLNLKQALNSQYGFQLLTGIYLADLAYCELFEQYQLARKYLLLVNELSKDVYLSQETRDQMSEFFRQDKLPLDSLSENLSDLFYQITYDLESADLQNVVSVIGAGAYIESLYLSVLSVSGNISDKKIQDKIGEQQYAFRNLLLYIQQVRNDPYINEILPELQKIEKIYESLSLNEEELTATPTENNLIRISGGKTFSIDGASYLQLKNAIIELRNDLIFPESSSHNQKTEHEILSN